MSDIPVSQPNHRANNTQSVLSELCRMLWMVFGPVGVFFTGVTLWKSVPWSYSVIDWIYWSLAILTIVAKWLHTKVFHGMTTDDKPAQMSDFWAYFFKFVVFAAVWWWFSQSRQM